MANLTDKTMDFNTYSTGYKNDGKNKLGSKSNRMMFVGDSAFYKSFIIRNFTSMAFIFFCFETLLLEDSKLCLGAIMKSTKFQKDQQIHQ